MENVPSLPPTSTSNTSIKTFSSVETDIDVNANNNNIINNDNDLFEKFMPTTTDSAPPLPPNDTVHTVNTVHTVHTVHTVNTDLNIPKKTHTLHTSAKVTPPSIAHLEDQLSLLDVQAVKLKREIAHVEEVLPQLPPFSRRHSNLQHGLTLLQQRLQEVEYNRHAVAARLAKRRIAVGLEPALDSLSLARRVSSL